MLAPIRWVASAGLQLLGYRNRSLRSQQKRQSCDFGTAVP